MPKIRQHKYRHKNEIYTDRAQLAHRYDTVVAKCSRSPQSTREQPKSHRKPRDVLEISLFRSMLALIPQSGDFSGAALKVRSVALLQVPKPAGKNAHTICIPQNNSLVCQRKITKSYQIPPIM